MKPNEAQPDRSGKVKTLLSLKQLQAGCIAGTNYATAELLAELNYPDYSKVGVTVETLTGPAYHKNVAVIAEGQPVHVVHVHLGKSKGRSVSQRRAALRGSRGRRMNPHAQALGKLGGKANTPAQNAARAENGKLGGRQGGKRRLDPGGC